jgi:hypothetical protein
MKKKLNRSKAKKHNLQGVQNEKSIANSGAIRKDAIVSSRNKKDQAKRDDRSIHSTSD